MHDNDCCHSSSDDLAAHLLPITYNGFNAAFTEADTIVFDVHGISQCCLLQ
jgi:hypothetical protein